MNRLQDVHHTTKFSGVQHKNWYAHNGVRAMVRIATAPIRAAVRVAGIYPQQLSRANFLIATELDAGFIISRRALLSAENSPRRCLHRTAPHPGAHYDFGAALGQLKQKGDAGQGEKPPSRLAPRVDEENRGLDCLFAVACIRSVPMRSSK